MKDGRTSLSSFRPVWEGKMSLAPVWLWGGTSGTARKRALTEASFCVIVVLEDGVVGAGAGVQDRKTQKEGKDWV